MTALILALVFAPLCGCSIEKGAPVESPTDALHTLATAKAEAMSMENEISSLVPEEYVASRRQLDKVPVLDCDAHRGLFTWPGHSTVVLKADLDKLALIELIATHRHDSPDFELTQSTEFGGVPGLEIVARDGATFFVDFQKSGSELKIHSFSPCFALPEGNNGGDY